MTRRTAIALAALAATAVLGSARSNASTSEARAGWIIFRLDMDPTGHAVGQPRMLLDGVVASGPGLRISPDSRVIKFCYQGADVAGTGLIGAHGGTPQLIPIPGYTCGATIDTFGWSGSDLMLYDRRSEPGAFKTMNTTTGELTTLQQFPVTARRYSYIPETREVVIISGGGRGAAGREIHAISMVSGADRLVAKVDGLQWVIASPGGRDLIVAVGTEMRTMTLDGNPGRVILRAAEGVNRFNPLAVSGNGKFVLYLAITDSTPVVRVTRVLNIATGESWPLLKDDVSLGPPGVDWSPDGSFIAMAADVPVR